MDAVISVPNLMKDYEELMAFLSDEIQKIVDQKVKEALEAKS
jgi:hypothetical protein